MRTLLNQNRKIDRESERKRGISEMQMSNQPPSTVVDEIVSKFCYMSQAFVSICVVRCNSILGFGLLVLELMTKKGGLLCKYDVKFLKILHHSKQL